VSAERASTDGDGSSEAKPRPDGGDADEYASDANALQAPDPAICRDHGLVHPDSRPWLPKQENQDLAPHPYCTECGEVMGIGKAGGLDKGDLVNLVSQLETRLDRAGHVVTEAQKRLILQKISEKDLDDPFGFTRDTQLSHVCQIASTYLGIPEATIMSYVRST
jgi:hypothetical protein